jgi:hypothetical protein
MAFSGMEIASTQMFNHSGVDMTKSANTIPQAARGGIVKVELLDILQAIITAGGGLLAIHLILDEAKTMTDIRTRYIQWQTDKRAVSSK